MSDILPLCTCYRSSEDGSRVEKCFSVGRDRVLSVVLGVFALALISLASYFLAQGVANIPMFTTNSGLLLVGVGCLGASIHFMILSCRERAGAL
ncbi:MAG: hypothetical protein K940chlam9_00865 [Chlamydiae bacterium]|nr:hypothetical protein [Chlamydiota bacterium]